MDFRKGDDAYELRLAIRRLKPPFDAGVWTSRPVVLGENISLNQACQSGSHSSKINLSREVFGSLQVEVGSGEGRIEKQIRKIAEPLVNRVHCRGRQASFPGDQLLKIVVQ